MLASLVVGANAAGTVAPAGLERAAWIAPSHRYLWTHTVSKNGMSEWLTQEELDRISHFANTPGYDRTPEMLVPEQEEE